MSMALAKGGQFLNGPVQKFKHRFSAPALASQSHTQEGSSMSFKGRNGVRRSVIAFAVFALLALAPAAFARSHVGVGINIGGPGFGIGYSSGCRHCGGYWGGYVAPYYSYAPAYYAPAYYGPAYYDYGDYYDRPYYRTRVVEHVRYYDRDDRHHDRGYYDRDRGYHDRDRDYRH
jgi:hypothetical protein